MAEPEVSARGTAADDGFELIGSGLNVYETPEPVQGRTRWLDTPEQVIEFVADGTDIEDTILVVRGGATTFLTPALTAGIRGVLALQGAPESHLGIVSREFGIPCLLSVSFTQGVRTDRGEVVPADGVRVRLDVSTRPHGTVTAEVGAPVDDEPVAAESGGMSPEQQAEIQRLLDNFGGEVPHGDEGDAAMRATLTTRVLHLDDDPTERDLTVRETNELIRYLTWNEWDALAARATEGESGLIPRQEYEAAGIMNSWFKHPEWLRVMQDRVGPQGMVELGATARREIGTKVNLLHSWAMIVAASFGRGIALELGLHDQDHRAETIVTSASAARRLYKGHWGDGPMFSSMRGYQARLLDQEWIGRFRADRVALHDPQSRDTFQRFNASTELLGFLLHFDNRLGLGDHGPYPLADGGFVVVRDLFINEPAFPWSDISAGLPYAVTLAMFVGPDSGLDVKVTDLSTLFTSPANYLQHVEGVAVYTRQHHDTPMSELATLSLDDMSALRGRIEDTSARLYQRIAGMTRDEKIVAGARVYTSGFALPYARGAGVLDELVDHHGFFELAPPVCAAWDQIASGAAAEMIPRLFLTGSWGVPLAEG